ncbi:uncharacterized protein LOC121053853 [Oryza brachyantha]|uniref:uncharacterized protein LOC121053853 n=1 Tax=Oryza brachyantha TaxID=4533 RepID=UPI001ADA757D|nr:uncharacterized protein LOC121053853 [Oryza brachyantha]
MDPRRQHVVQGITAAVNMWDLLADEDPGDHHGTTVAKLPPPPPETKSMRKKEKRMAAAAAAEDDAAKVVVAAADAPAAPKEVPIVRRRSKKEKKVKKKKAKVAPAARNVEEAVDSASGGLEREVAAGGDGCRRSPCLAVVGEMLKAVVAAGFVAFFYSVVTASTTV